jgi:hypothetical protein
LRGRRILRVDPSCESNLRLERSVDASSLLESSSPRVRSCDLNLVVLSRVIESAMLI